AHDALVDLGYFLLEELDDQPRVSAAEHNLRLTGAALDLFDERLDPVARAIRLARRLLAMRQDRVGPIEVDDDVALLEPRHDAGDALALAVFVLVVDQVTLRLADTLDDDLLGGLGCDASKALLGALELEDLAISPILFPRLVDVVGLVEDLHQQLVTHLNVEAVLHGVVQSDVTVRILDLVRDLHDLEQLDLAGLLVEVRFDLALRTEDSLRRR